MKRTNRHIWTVAGALTIAGAAFLAGRAFAGGIPSTGALTYSGTLEDATGAALTGSHNIQVFFWNAAAAGTSVCNTTSTQVTLDNGRFSVPLPDGTNGCVSAIKASPDVWAEVLVDGSSLGRTKIGAVPYAVEAGHATNADSATNATNATGTLASTIASLQTSVTQMQSDIAALKTDFGATYSHGSGQTSITSSSWTWVGGTPAINVAAGERLFVWNTGAVYTQDTSGGAACPGCTSYSDAWVAPCYIQNGDTGTPHVGSQTVVSNPVNQSNADIAFSTADYFTFTSATSNVQLGLCAYTLADGVHLDFLVDHPGTIVLRAPVHGP